SFDGPAASGSGRKRSGSFSPQSQRIDSHVSGSSLAVPRGSLLSDVASQTQPGKLQSPIEDVVLRIGGRMGLCDFRGDGFDKKTSGLRFGKTVSEQPSY